MTPATDAARETIARIVCDIVVQITCAENASDASIHAQVDQSWHHWTDTADRILALTEAASQPREGNGQDWYVIRRHGAFFRPDAAGYTTHIGSAGFYTREQADSYADVEGVTIARLSDWRAEAQAAIDGAARLSAALTQRPPEQAGASATTRNHKETGQ